jgi:hypothetical protein
MGRRSPALLVALGFALLLAAWVVASQPFSAPDEGSHYLRALSIANGHLLGPKIPYPTPLIPAQRAFVNQDTRAVLVPAVLGPNVTRCIDGRPNVSGSCVEASPTGDYYPPAYLLPALAIKVSNRTDTALWLGRALSTALCFVFVALSVALLWDGSAWSLLGLLAAITPMVLFISSVLNPSGLDTVASVAFASAGIRIGRGPDRVRPWIWIAFVLSGALTALSFQAGPAFLVADLVVVAALAGSGRLGDLRRSQRRPLVTAGLILLAALVLWFVYARVSGASHSQFGVSPFFHSLRVGLHQLGPVLRDAIGTFSTLTVHLPAAVCWVWWLLVLAGVAAALWLGSRRERVLMILVLLLALAFPVLAYAWFYRHSGFPMQGRQVLPVLVLIPLTAGELIRRHRDRIAFRARAWVLAVPIGVIAILQGYAWWYDARKAAGAPATLRFYAHAAWSPPLGWIPWIVVAALGVLALLAFSAVATLGPGRDRRSPPRAAT